MRILPPACLGAFLGVCLAAALAASPATAREYYVGGPVHVHDMEIVANYLVGVEMEPAMPDMPTGDDVIHLEADVHATADNVFGFPEGAWIPYLGMGYRLAKQGSPWTHAGTLHPMQAKDGPHYADNVRMAGPGHYTLTYDIAPPPPGFMRHVDKETGVPPWWAPFSESFAFDYPQK